MSFTFAASISACDFTEFHDLAQSFAGKEDAFSYWWKEFDRKHFHWRDKNPLGIRRHPPRLLQAYEERTRPPRFIK